jgi:hypothetical protein
MNIFKLIGYRFEKVWAKVKRHCKGKFAANLLALIMNINFFWIRIYDNESVEFGQFELHI